MVGLVFTSPLPVRGESGRDRWQEPKRILDALNIREGTHVADLGAGYGYFTFRLARRAGKTGRVFAVDVSKPRLKYLRRRARASNRKSKSADIRVLRGNDRESGLPPGGVDLILSVNTYHHLKNRVAYFRRLKQVFRKGGRLALIDYRPKDERYSGHSIARAIIVREMKAAGYRLVLEFKFLEKQNFLVYAPES